MSDSLPPSGLQPSRLLHPWDSQGKNTGMGCHFLIQGIFQTQRSNQGLPHCRQTLSHLSHQGSIAIKIQNILTAASFPDPFVASPLLPPNPGDADLLFVLKSNLFQHLPYMQAYSIYSLTQNDVLEIFACCVCQQLTPFCCSVVFHKVCSSSHLPPVGH